MKNKIYIKRSVKSVWHPCTQMKHHENLPLIPISRGKGVWLYDFDGKKYLDVTSSWWVNLFGHNNKIIKKYISKQLNTLEHSMLAGLTHAPVIELSEKLSKLTKLGHCSYGSDGANAVEIALKMSTHYWSQTGFPLKNKYIYLENSYHGETLGALAVTDVPIFRSHYGALIKNYIKTDSPDLRLKKSSQSIDEFLDEKLKKLKKIFEKNHDVTASIILEPMVQCASGMGIYDARFLSSVRELCDEFDVHLIADEIAVGFGRTGKMFAHQHAQITPDFVCLSKGLTGGYLPMSVTLTSDKIYNAFYDDDIKKGFLHSHSYTGNPLACSAALGTLSIFESENILKKNLRLSKKINQLFLSLEGLPIYNLRNIGMIWAFELDQKVSMDKVVEFSLNEGLLIRPIDKTIYFMPPYCIKESEAKKMIKITREAILYAIT
ncbi:MAG: adenosylmethionine--8-amino-7-oxononanoate transaminase [Nitrosomonadales bacterium]|jgi:adenosylmethionine-8-amino-7-oxononanoate aminotransferase|nr:adenosylmethionine--8-amino-7-oxononanoate transaminase [Nitrosomonadales bacterium]MBT3918712.1 adenosylmethionine--8-amino-7-oxononanoate transaminase [Nitrosomonadales bacterium]MBT4182470.1 adenosylmethionine--8-amino-7-oxononanoate transaminase [Nitrosomonadales bacterium]MBT4570922.1 adenosylmethionine--8-amino-7-oxononanoate transaminase [Nitrosomonadales bacterium]MBT4758868.1 adenosylmethionine--8-amino-7-oxononanoate transaminase [Nitrosomonadales bacterium]